jgi:hypothetical protein
METAKRSPLQSDDLSYFGASIHLIGGQSLQVKRGKNFHRLIVVGDVA